MAARGGVVLLSVVFLATLVARGAAESAGVPAQAASPVLSTASGVYSDEQAKRGEETYMSICTGCHTGTTYASQMFKTTWTGRPLSELFELISTKMPEDDPGSLTPKEYAQVVAYILKINKMPPGKNELPSDMEALKQIRLELEIK
jgi:mono/diheme cytochrome c family protein